MTLDIFSWIVTHYATTLILIFTGSSFFIMLYDRLSEKPRIWFCFPDKSRIIQYRSNEETTITFHFENIGDFFKLKRPKATKITVFLYFPLNFEVREIRRAGYKNNEIFKTPNSGRFKNMQYIVVPTVYGYTPPAITALDYKETEICEVDLKMPKETGIYDIFSSTLSAQGDLGIDKLTISII